MYDVEITYHIGAAVTQDQLEACLHGIANVIVDACRDALHAATTSQTSVEHAVSRVTDGNDGNWGIQCIMVKLLLSVVAVLARQGCYLPDIRTSWQEGHTR